LAVYSQGSAQSGCTGLSGGSPDSVRCARLAQANWPLLGIHRRRTAIIHRTVRCAPDCPVSQRSAGPMVRRRHWTVRCAPDMSGAPTAPRLPTVGFAIEGKKSAPDSVRCAPDCPVHHPTEGKICLPGLLPMAPRPLVPIKGTPRRLKQCISVANKCRHHSDQFSLSLLCVSL
jgi:hypothetical protein